MNTFCTICLDDYEISSFNDIKYPYILECGRTFCLQCIRINRRIDSQILRSQKAHVCAICRCNSSQYFKNFDFMKLIEEHNKLIEETAISNKNQIMERKEFSDSKKRHEDEIKQLKIIIESKTKELENFFVFCLIKIFSHN